MEYLPQKLMAYILAGGESATCPVTGIYIGKNGEYHHIFGRVSGADVLAEASDPHLCLYMSNKAHRQYHNEKGATSDQSKDELMQIVYRIWAGRYGSVEKAYEMCKEAYERLQSKLQSPISYQLPEPNFQLEIFSF